MLHFDKNILQTSSEKKTCNSLSFEGLCPIAKNVVLSLLCLPVMFVCIILFVMNVSDIAGGLYSDGALLYYFLLFFQILLSFTLYEQSSNLLTRLISWFAFPFMAFITVMPEYTDLVVFYLLLFESIMQLKHNEILHSKFHFFTSKTVKTLFPNTLFSSSFGKILPYMFALFIILFGISSIDYYSPTSYVIDEVSTAQGFMLALQGEGADVPTDAEVRETLLAERNVTNTAESYMVSELSCRSYSIQYPTEINLVKDEATNEYFYTFVLIGKEYFGNYHSIGFVINAENGSISYVNEMSVS